MTCLLFGDPPAHVSVSPWVVLLLFATAAVGVWLGERRRH